MTVFAPLHGADAQDETRLALTRALVTDGTTRIDRWQPTQDRASFGGHFYADKAPGISLLAIPGYGVERAVGGTASAWRGAWSRWSMRVLVNGPALLLIALLLAREGERLGGSGLLLAVAAILGTVLGATASILFSHVAAAALVFAAFVAASRERCRPFLAGALAGTAVVVEYQSGIVLVVVGCLVGLGGVRRLGRYVAGAVPPIAVLALYDWLSFGSPFHLSYRYVANAFAAQQHAGFFGIGTPRLQTLRAVLLGGSGLHVGTGILITAPLFFGSMVGAVLLWRRGLRREVLAIAAICAGYLAYNAGYFLPFGGASPGPRFLVPAIPFAVLPLAACYERWRAVTIVLVLVSVGFSTEILVAWFPDNGTDLDVLPATIWSEGGLSRMAGVVLVFATAAASLLAAGLPVRRRARI